MPTLDALDDDHIPAPLAHRPATTWVYIDDTLLVGERENPDAWIASNVQVGGLR